MRWWGPAATAALLVGMTGASVLSGLGVAAALLTQGYDPNAPISEMMSPGLLAASLLAQFALFVPLALAVAVALPDGTWAARIARALPLRCPPAWVGLGVVLGLTVAHLPAWAVAAVGRWFGAHSLISELLPGGPPSPALGVTIVLLGPVSEEVVFRGVMWSAWERSWRPAVVLGVTSALFGLYHLDPMQVLWTLWLGLVMGWLRLRSGSLLPSIAMHVTNNGLAVVAGLAGDHGERDLTMAGAVGVATSVIALAMAGWGELRLPRPVAPSTAS